MTSYIPQSAKITDIRDLNPNTRMFTLDIFLGATPGQFVNLWIPELDEKPFSVAFDNGNSLKLAIAKVGPFTERLFSFGIGDAVGIRGPFGKGFTLHKKKNIVLVGGGFGAAPLHFLGEQSQKQGSDITMIVGARSEDLLIYEKECLESGFRLIQTTNDGSKGEEGFVTMPLERLLQEEQIDVVQTCGPEKMMEAVAKICEQYGVLCEVSLERYMKCGFGVCGQCVCDKKLVCTDGPVFSGEDVLGFSDFGKFHRGAEGQKEAY